MLKLRRRALASAVALGMLAFSGANAHAELRMAGGESTPAVLRFPGPSALVYTVQVTAEGQDERFALQFDAPWFGRDGTGTAPIGASLSFVGQTPRIEGAAQLLGPSLTSAGYVACGPTVPVHGFDSERHAWDVLVPAGTTSTLSFDFIPAPSSPWPDTSYAVTFEALPRMVDREPATLAAPQSVTVAGPPTAGSRGVHLTLRSTPKTTLVGMRDAARVRIGRRHRDTRRHAPAPAQREDLAVDEHARAPVVPPDPDAAHRSKGPVPHDGDRQTRHPGDGQGRRARVALPG